MKQIKHFLEGKNSALRPLFLRNSSPLLNFIEITLQHGCSPVNLLHIFRTPFYKNTYRELLLTTASTEAPVRFRLISGLHHWKILRLWASAIALYQEEFWQQDWQQIPIWSSRPEVFFKTGALKKFVKLTGKHLCSSLSFNKVADLRSAILLRKRFGYRCFPVNLWDF